MRLKIRGLKKVKMADVLKHVFKGDHNAEVNFRENLSDSDIGYGSDGTVTLITKKGFIRLLEDFANDDENFVQPFHQLKLPADIHIEID